MEDDVEGGRFGSCLGDWRPYVEQRVVENGGQEAAEGMATKLMV